MGVVRAARRATSLPTGRRAAVQSAVDVRAGTAASRMMLERRHPRQSTGPAYRMRAGASRGVRRVRANAPDRADGPGVEGGTRTGPPPTGRRRSAGPPLLYGVLRGIAYVGDFQIGPRRLRRRLQGFVRRHGAPPRVAPPRTGPGRQGLKVRSLPPAGKVARPSAHQGPAAVKVIGPRVRRRNAVAVRVRMGKRRLDRLLGSVDPFGCPIREDRTQPVNRRVVTRPAACWPPSRPQ